MNKWVLLVVLSVALLVASGCSTYSEQSRDIRQAWQAGDGMLAATNVTVKAEKSAGSKDELIWRLEQGTILSAVGNIQAGLTAFDRAETLVDQYEQEANLKVGSEGLSLFSNQANLPYRGRAYDKIMMNTYKALNYMLLLQPDDARVELNRSLQRQRDAVAENSRKIEKAEEAAEQAKSGSMTKEDGSAVPDYDVNRAQSDPRFAAAVETEMARVDDRLLAYADYVNPFSVFLDGVFFSHLGEGISDFERARKAFERVKGMSPGSYIAADYAMAEALCNGVPPGNITYILFSTGSAPSRDQVRLDIPLFMLTDEVSYVGASFPKLVYHDNCLSQISATVSGQSLVSEELCSMDAVISRDFKNEWPAVMTKTLLTSATKAATGRVAETALDDNVMGKWAARAISAGYQAATNIADLRTWTTLPKKFAYIRTPTPEDGVVFLSAGGESRQVNVVPGKTNVILVRSVNPASRPIIETFTLN